MRQPPSGPFTLLISLVLLCFASAWGISFAVPLPAREDFNIARWELEHLPNKWLYLTGRLLDGKLSRTEEDARLGHFLELTAQIERLRSSASSGDAGTAPAVAKLERERDRLESDVEAIIEGRITAVLEEQGLASSLPLFPDARWVWPPVDTEIQTPPAELVISPRDRIELIDERPLEPGLSLTKIKQIEIAEERNGTRSALVEPLAGVATYPSIVEPDWNYQSLVEVAAHEWVHQYLVFKPLGRRFYSSVELQTLNETVATVSGEALAALVVQRYPLPAAIDAELATLAPPAPQIDVGPALRDLRLQVDAMLAHGQVGAAEALMEQRRQELAKQGVYYRRINQAFFAFANIYATDPASTDPIGAKIKTLQTRTGGVGAFLRAASELTSEGALDGLLARGTTP